MQTPFSQIQNAYSIVGDRLVLFGELQPGKDTEPDVVLAPGAHWTKFLWSKLDKLAKKKIPLNRSFHIDNADIAVYINYRDEADLTTRSDGLDISWKMIESKLRAWEQLSQLSL
ncbi:hypothetical protein NOF04DRAFT_1313020 [Fusarium oxysporum II5]|nr:hypothetical protein NOF04DRAFT_1313020 [Fusarium oxysporum II5]